MNSRMKGKKNMNTKKQTLFLFTMLALMVVLSAYYMLTENRVPVASEDGSGQLSVSEEGVTPDGVATMNGITTSMNNLGGSDYFDALALEKSIKNAELQSYYADILVNASDADVIADAKNRIDELMTREEKELVLEEVIKSQGFGEVVVMTQDNKVHVVVQSAEDLDLTQADQIIGVAAQHFNIQGNEVVVYTHP